MSFNLFIHSENGTPLRKGDLPSIKKVSNQFGCKLKYEIHDDGKLDNIELVWEGCEFGLSLSLGDRNEDREDTDEYFYGYWVEDHEDSPVQHNKFIEILKELCTNLNFLFDDPQRARGVNPVWQDFKTTELGNYIYTNKEMEKIEKEKKEREKSKKLDEQGEKLTKDLEDWGKKLKGDLKKSERELKKVDEELAKLKKDT